MASYSSASDSPYCPRWKYDVFLSFRGADTRRTFTGHLFEGLKNRGIFIFQDDKRLEHGDSISEELLKAIEESQVAIIVFSKNYATSRWCLNELVKITECKAQKGQIVIPVFYDVDPSHVRHQSESFEEAFTKHESRYKDDVEGMQKVQAWRTALTASANLKGYDIRDGIESDCIQHIVDHVSSKLSKASVSYLRNVVGIDTHLEKVKSMLEMEINDVRIVGIWGMGGVGKTTIARAIFDTLSPQFDGACFLADIKENKCGMHTLQNILLSELLRKKDNYVNNEEDGKHMIARRLRFKKVLAVLDDIDHSDHLDNLAGDLDWFGKGSRIIATTRDKHLMGKNDAVYEVTPLLDCDAIELFHRYAFKEEVPDRCFEKLSWKVINYAKGLPLALKVWGSFLHKRDITEWRSAIEQMKINSKSEIVEKLKISYDRLETIQQDIFLDIACFLRGNKKDYVMPILESCYSGANIELSVLIDKSLVFIDYNTIQMHDLIQDMGRYIVKIRKDPGERSRLWDVEDIEEVMVNNTGTMAVEAIWCTYIQKLCFSREAIKNMKRLRILYLCYRHDESRSQRYPYYFPLLSSSSDSKDIPYDSNCHDGSIEYLSNYLCWFVWHYYPWNSLPEIFKLQRLVHLDLRWSSLHELWTKRKILLPSLRELDLGGSKSLMQTPDFTGMPNLEYLKLNECTSLKEVHHSVGCCRKLIHLDLYHCISLERFPCVNVESLGSLDLRYCSSLEKFPEFLGRMKPKLFISVGGSEIRRHFYDWPTMLDLSSWKNLVVLPSSIGMLKSLVNLTISGCSKFKSLPEEIGDLENLEVLNASYTLISQPPSSIVRLNKLKSLSFAKQKFMPNGRSGVFFVFPHVNEGFRSLDHLDLSFCNLIDGGLPEDMGCLSSLKELYLEGNDFEHLPRSMAQLSSLRLLDLSDCKRLKQLPEFQQQLHTIDADWSNDSLCNMLFQNISSLQHDISSSDSLSLKVITTRGYIPRWFHHQENGFNISVELPENWYVSDNFLGFALCYSGKLTNAEAHLICYDGRPVTRIIQKLALSNHSKYPAFFAIHFFLVPLAGLWDTSKANGRTPNDYRCIRLYSPGERKEFGLRLLYKDEPKIEASCSSSKKQG